MTFSVVNSGAQGAGRTSLAEAIATFAYSGLSDGDLIVTGMAAWQGNDYWQINGGGLGTPLYRHVTYSGTQVIVFTVFQVFGQPSSGTLTGRAASNDSLGGVAYWIVHDSDGYVGHSSDFLGADLSTPADYYYQSTSGPRSGSHALTVPSRAAAFGGDQLIFGIGGIWDYNVATSDPVNPSTLSTPSGMAGDGESSQVLGGPYQDQLTGMGAHATGAPGTAIPSYTSTLNWSRALHTPPFPDQVGFDSMFATGAVFLKRRSRITFDKTVVGGTAIPSDSTVFVYGSFGGAFANGGDILYLPDGTWAGTEASGGGPSYHVTDVSGTGVTWDGSPGPSSAFTIVVSGDGTIHITNTAPVTGNDPYWGVLLT